MARRMIKFPLKMKNGAEVRSLEELRANADVESIVKYFFSGQLSLWCRAYGYTNFSEQLETINAEFIENIYKKLEIPYNISEIQEYLIKNYGFSVMSNSTHNDIEEVSVVDNQNVKKKLEKYVDSNICLSDYLIEVTPINDDDGKTMKYKVTIENEKSEQYSKFVLPYDVSGSYTQQIFEDDLYKKIAYALKKKVEEYGYLKLKNSRYAELKVGDTFEFGKFEGKPIKWLVLTNRDGKLLVLSDKILCKRAYGGRKWDKSDIRVWLNNEFYDSSFSESEKNLIDLSERTNYDGIMHFNIAENTKDGTTFFNSDMTTITLFPKSVIDIDGILCKVPYGDEKNAIKTQDNIFLLSGFEVENYLQGVLANKKQINGDWLLSSSYSSESRVLYVQYSGARLSLGNSIISIKFYDTVCGIRPAFWLKY